MKYPCDVIQDLLPLYLDGVCSEESKAAVAQHLSECPACKQTYEALCEAETVVPEPLDAANEIQKAASFQAVRKRLKHRQIGMVAAVFVMVGALLLVTVGVLKHTVRPVENRKVLSVSMVDGSLVGRLIGSRDTHTQIKRVTATVEGRQTELLFYAVENTQWDALTTSSEVFSEQMLCPAEKGADEIDRVYYYTGDYTGLESKTPEELQAVIETATLLWSK